MTILRTASASILAALLAACTPAATGEGGAGASAAAGSVIRSSCRQGECVWLRVTGQETVETLPQGELRRLVARRGTSVHLDGNVPERAPASGIEWQAADETSYAFCSQARPAYAFPSDDGSLTVHFLDLFNLGGYQTASAGMYLRLCHAIDEFPEDEKVLSGLGYRPGTRDEQVEAGSLQTMTRF
jgi:hypothetical protein